MDTPGSIGTRLRELRKRSGVSSQQIADLWGVHPSQVTRAEQGTRQVSGFEVGLLAEHFGWSVRELLGMDSDRSRMAVAARLRSSDGSPNVAIRRAADLLEVDAILDEADWGERPVTSVPQLNLPAPRSRGEAVEQGRNAADVARSDLEITGAVGNLVELFEQHGVDVLVAPLGPDCDGLVASVGGTTLAAVASGPVSGRQRFTLAHELGHLVAADVTETARFEGSDDEGDLTEARADAFAAAFLMPESGLRETLGDNPQEWELVDAMLRFGVSRSALRRRCVALGIPLVLTQIEQPPEELFASVGRLDEHDVAVSSIPPRLPSRIAHRVRDAYAHGVVGAGLVRLAFGVEGDDLAHLLRSIEPKFTAPHPVPASFIS